MQQIHIHSLLQKIFVNVSINYCKCGGYTNSTSNIESPQKLKIRKNKFVVKHKKTFVSNEDFLTYHTIS